MRNNRNHPRKILVPYASVGAGHRQAAKAIVERLSEKLPDTEIKVVDTLDFTSTLFRAYYNGGYVLAMTRFPSIYGLGFALSDGPDIPHRAAREKPRLAMEWTAMKKFRKFVMEYQPDAIINTHFLSPPVITRMARQGQITTRQFVVATDIVVHRWWFSQGIEHWFTPFPESIERFAKWGIPPSDITVSGIPIMKKWTHPLDKEKILKDWRLPADKPIILFSGGTEFVCGPVVDTVKGIISRCKDALVIVLAGRNKKLLAELSGQEEAGKNLLPMAFTDRGHELVEVCSLFVTKAGGITTSECLAKKTPTILTDPVPGQELGNAKFLADRGAAVIAKGKKQIINETVNLLNNPEKLKKMSENAHKLHSDSANIITDEIVRRLARS